MLQVDASPNFKMNGEMSNNGLVKLNQKLKAEANLANGGIGVSYSNVVLGGATNISAPVP